MTQYELNPTGQQMADLPYSELWRISEQYRESVDAWDFKHYIFGLIVYRFMSQSLTEHVRKLEESSKTPHKNFASLNDRSANSKRESIVKNLGYYIPPSELFDNVKESSIKNRNIIHTLSKVFKNIVHSSKTQDGRVRLTDLFFDFDLSSIMLGETEDKRSQKLESLMDELAVAIDKIAERKISEKYGMIFEYLMTKYAVSASKSGDQYFSPLEISDILVGITTLERKIIRSVYDPACGTGSLLSKFTSMVRSGDEPIAYFGQEINKTTYNLCRMNLILHGIDIRDIKIEHGNTLLEPKGNKRTTFDVVVSNLPFSVYWRSSELPHLLADDRFAPAEVLAPKTRGELAFVMHSLSKLSKDGTAAISLLPGALSRSGAEEKIRKYLIDKNFIDSIIQLPPNLLFSTSLPLCVMVLKKNRTNREVFFYDASKEFRPDKFRNRLGEKNINKILDSYFERDASMDGANKVELYEIEKRNYNLLPKNYTRLPVTRKKIEVTDLERHLNELVKNRTSLAISVDNAVADIARYNNAT